MPYVSQKLRELLSEVDPRPLSAGELNYCITALCAAYWNRCGPDYQTINDVVGALEGAKLEFYRRVAVPYEDHKKDLNGDVY